MAADETYDVAIIGAGPAGSALAWLLNKEIKVAVLDKKSTDCENGFRKPCGGLLSTDAQKSMSKFGLTLPKDVLVSPQIFSVKTIDLDANCKRHYQRFYVNLDRHKFDLWLMSLIPPNVDIIAPVVCVSVEKTEGFHKIYYKKGEQLCSLNAKYVVGSDGASSMLRKSLFPQIKIMKYISIQQWFIEENAAPFYSCIFDRKITDCYCWSVSKDGFFILGGAFDIKTGKKNFELLKEKLAKNGYTFGLPVKTEACMVFKPNSPLNICTGKNGIFLIGEAAGFISPSSLEGISYAFDSAYELAKVLNSGSGNPNRSYFFATSKIRLKLLVKCFKALAIYTPFCRKLIMKSGLGKINVIND